jgi:Zn-dependent protease
MHFNFIGALLNVVMLWILTAPHEFAHAWVGTKLGDQTPRLDGRVTLNPLAHIDWIGTAALPFITSLLGGGFLGWGKPVRSDVSQLKGGLNGLVLVALAGPFSNVIMAVILATLGVALAGHHDSVASYLLNGAELSLYLAIFNMLPVPPLDGSKFLLAARIPAWLYNEIARGGFLLLILAVSVSNIGHWMNQWAQDGTFAIVAMLAKFGLTLPIPGS